MSHSPTTSSSRPPAVQNESAIHASGATMSESLDLRPEMPMVQDLARSKERVPDKYIYKDSECPYGVDLPLVDILTVDTDMLETPSSSEELGKLRSSLLSCGCFYAVNHAVTPSFLHELRRTCRQFFSLTAEEKNRYARPADGIEGYGGDMVLSEEQILDWTDRLYLLINPEDQRKLSFWPENPLNFRNTMQEYTKNLIVMAEVLLKAMARMLNLDEDSFLKQYGLRPNMFARFNLYPPCLRADRVLGLKPHTDGSVITFVLQDEAVEGLQVLNGGQWSRVPIIPDAVLVNVGDQIEIMSNGHIKSPLHRVVISPQRERISIAVFCSTETDNEVGPVDELINEDGSRLYAKVKNYPETYFQYYQLGIRAIDVLRVNSDHSSFTH